MYNQPWDIICSRFLIVVHVWQNLAEVVLSVGCKNEKAIFLFISCSYNSWLSLPGILKFHDMHQPRGCRQEKSQVLRYKCVLICRPASLPAVLFFTETHQNSFHSNNCQFRNSEISGLTLLLLISPIDEYKVSRVSVIHHPHINKRLRHCSNYKFWEKQTRKTYNL